MEKKYYTIQIKQRNIVLRLNKYVADQSIKEGNPVYAYEILENLLDNFLINEGY